MIELAPHHKIGLPLSNPVMIASGCGGYGQAYRQLINLSAFGALVTNPITLRPQRGIAQSRLAETTAGFVLDTGHQNPGVKKVIREYSKHWLGLSVPVIAHLPADEPDDLRRTAGALAGTEAVAGIELGIPSPATPRDIAIWIEAVREGCMLPLLIKLPLDAAVEMAEIAVEAAVDALVVGLPPLGSAQTSTGAMVDGFIFGPALHSMALYAVQEISDIADIPLIAVGGIHSLVDVQAFLAAGAVAVQLDSLLFIEPQLAADIASAVSD
jgi:dihydroorotate dehydrogenase (NAD+) catalytic subunit